MQFYLNQEMDFFAFIGGFPFGCVLMILHKTAFFFEYFKISSPTNV